MRLWLSGPRILHGLVRPGISFSGRELSAFGRRPPAVTAAGMLGVFRRDTDGAIFLGVTDQNGENEHLANVKPVAAFAFSSADAAITAREGAIVRLAKHLNTDGLLVGLSVGQAVSPSVQKRPRSASMRDLSALPSQRTRPHASPGRLQIWRSLFRWRLFSALYC